MQLQGVYQSSPKRRSLYHAWCKGEAMQLCGCTSNAKKGGVCYRHRSKSIITLTNPVLQSNAIPPSIPPHQAVDYEDKEDLNLWIWGSS
jgi:hypothetical protein